jgi:hypothetical protein
MGDYELATYMPAIPIPTGRVDVFLEVQFQLTQEVLHILKDNLHLMK